MLVFLFLFIAIFIFAVFVLSFSDKLFIKGSSKLKTICSLEASLSRDFSNCVAYRKGDYLAYANK